MYVRAIDGLGQESKSDTKRLVRVQITPRERKRVGKYDRFYALNYAHRYWSIPCNNQFIALASRSGRNFVKVPTGTKFEHEFDNANNSKGREHALLPDGSRIEWEDLDDCTHYISCCIGLSPGDWGGGIPITYRQLGSPPNAPYGITRVSTMVEYLLGNKTFNKKGTTFAKLIGDKTSDDSLIKKLDPGDLIAYWNNDKDSKRYKSYTHLAMYLGNHKIGSHTYCRFDDPACTWDKDWDLGRGTYLWTFLHFIV